MAINLWTAALLWHLCEQTSAKSVCDLGSGFTSYALRRYAADRDVTVHSVDDDPKWLGRTGQFLARHLLPTDGLLTFDEWVEFDGRYDVILHDFNGGEVRERVMTDAVQHLEPGGAIIFDDAQHVGHHATMTDVCHTHGLILLDTWAVTTDETGRWAALAWSV